MKFLLSILTVGFVTATLPIYGKPRKLVTIDEVKADSPFGAKLISQARRLDYGADYSWIGGFSVKFQGCHHISQWNDEAEDADEVRIQTKRLVRFRLCPSDSCKAHSSSGCSSGYGDYVIDMDAFLTVYADVSQEQNEYMCEYTEANCECNEENYGDDYTEEKCIYDCYNKAGIADICADNNPYAEDGEGQQEKFQLADYLECKQFEVNNERRLEENQGDENEADDADEADEADEADDEAQDEEEEEEAQDEEEEEDEVEEEEEPVDYFIGPYCGEQGGAIYLGLFTDDTCTQYADSKGGAYTYKSITGTTLPYSKKSLISHDCLSCLDNNDGNYEVSEMCQYVYEESGKCEKSLYAAGVTDYPNTNACNYIKGIKVVRKDGIITQVGSKANKTASIFIGIFVVAFVLLASYVYYLKTKLDRASINLAE